MTISRKKATKINGSPVILSFINYFFFFIISSGDFFLFHFVKNKSDSSRYDELSTFSFRYCGPSTFLFFSQQQETKALAY
jgi:hypothetical protein